MLFELTLALFEDINPVYTSHFDAHLFPGLVNASTGYITVALKVVFGNNVSLFKSILCQISL